MTVNFTGEKIYFEFWNSNVPIVTPILLIYFIHTFRNSNPKSSHANQCFYFLFSGNLEGFNMEATLAYGKARGIKLLLNGYEFYKNGLRCWRCRKYKQSCKVRVMAVEINGKMMAKIKKNVEHNHPREMNWSRILRHSELSTRKRCSKKNVWICEKGFVIAPEKKNTLAKWIPNMNTNTQAIIIQFYFVLLSSLIGSYISWCLDWMYLRLKIATFQNKMEDYQDYFAKFLFNEQIKLEHFREALSFSVHQFTHLAINAIRLNSTKMCNSSTELQSFYYFPSIPEFCDHAVFGLTQRGAPKLCHNGYEYVKDRTFNTSTNWRCCLFRKLSCRARAITRTINGIRKVKLSQELHTHPQLQKSK